MHMAQPSNETSSQPGQAQADDINVGFIAIMVAFFAAFLLVSLIGLEAVFYNQVDAETEAKAAPQGSPNTLLGKSKANWKVMSEASGTVDNILAAPKPNAVTGKMEYPKMVVKPVDEAMKEVAARYVTKGSGQ
jgi:hypothetical protein